MDLITDEDESDEESEEGFELSEKEQRFLQEAYDTYANTGDAWIQQRATSPPSCRTPFADAGNVQAVFDDFINLPDSWPLMRILIPLDGLSLQIERIITCVAAELVATHLYPETQTKFVKRVAKKLTAILACYLAGEVAWNPHVVLSKNSKSDCSVTVGRWKRILWSYSTSSKQILWNVYHLQPNKFQDSTSPTM